VGEVGYFRSKASTLHLIDPDVLTVELTLRHVRCEIPGCEDPAVGIILSAVCAFLCDAHKGIVDTDPRFAKVLQATVAAALKAMHAEAVNAAYENSDDDVVISYDGSQSVLDTARAATDFLAALPLSDMPITKETTPPTLATLGDGNTESIFLDVFTI
jgi:hypothetical protein